MTDGIEILLRESCSHPAMGLLRSAYEAGLYLMFIHYHPDFREASLGWLAGQVQWTIENLKRKDPTAEATAAQVVGATERDLRLFHDVRKRIEGFERALRQPHLAPLAAKVKAAKAKHGEWYTPFGGGKNLWELSRKLHEYEEEQAKREGVPVVHSWREAYKFLLSRYHEVLHGGDFGRWAKHDSEGAVIFEHVRSPEPVREVAAIASGISLQATRLSVRRFAPGKDDALKNWYVQKVQGPYVWLSTPPA